MTLPTATPTLPFQCPFCQRQNEVAAELAGCVAPCPGCGRDVLVPETLSRWSDPVPVISRRCWLLVSIPACALMGASLGALLLMLPMGYFSLSVIGLGVRHIGIAGSLGAAIGAMLGGMLGHRLCRD